MKRVLLFCWIIALIACAPKPDYQTEYQKNGTYPIFGGNFEEPVAVIVIERNGLFEVSASMGSAFLVDAERGLFGTAKHVVDLDVNYKIFFCKKAYQAERVLSGVGTDVDFIRITGSFDPSKFPKPYPFAESVNIGERAFIRGIHMHPQDLQKDKIIHGIIRNYYGLDFYKSEFTYDSLPASVTKTNIEFSNKGVQGSDPTMSSLIQRYARLVTDEEHKIGDKGFAGLSGGPTVNARREIIGVNSNQLRDEEIMVVGGDNLRYIPRVTLHIIPVQELKRALAQLK